MKTKPVRTLDLMTKRLQYHEAQISAIRAVISQLQSHPRVVYEIHIQQDMPNQRSIMVSGVNLPALCHTARRFDAAYNNRRERPFELFVRCGELRVAIDPVDAMSLLPSGNHGFTFSLDGRISKFPAPMVFRVGQEMPSAWYATVPTPEPVDVPA